MFQYPLFRIVDCFARRLPPSRGFTRVSISALSDRGLLLIDGLHRVVAAHRFNIRSFGSWIASCNTLRRGRRNSVSISALSDRGLLPTLATPVLAGFKRFNIRSFGSWIASNRVGRPAPAGGMCFNIRSFGSWIASRQSRH